MWVVCIVLKLLLNLVVDKLGSARDVNENSKVDKNIKKPINLPNESCVEL